MNKCSLEQGLLGTSTCSILLPIFLIFFFFGIWNARGTYSITHDRLKRTIRKSARYAIDDVRRLITYALAVAQKTLKVLNLLLIQKPSSILTAPIGSWQCKNK